MKLLITVALFFLSLGYSIGVLQQAINDCPRAEKHGCCTKNSRTAKHKCCCEDEEVALVSSSM